MSVAVVNSGEATTRFTLVRVIKIRKKEIETIQKKAGSDSILTIFCFAMATY